MKDTKVNEKDGRLTLECGVKLEGVRPKWFKDGKPIEPSKKYRCLSSDRDAKLVVYDLGPGDKGNYEVQFEDLAKSACKVTIERKFSVIFKNAWNGFAFTCVFKKQELCG